MIRLAHNKALNWTAKSGAPIAAPLFSAGERHRWQSIK
jgi:hypothetical protein